MLENFQDRKSVTDAHGVYLIRVLGELDSRWLDYFDGISISVNASEGKDSISTLCTHESDQAAVMGILNSLYQFGYPLLYLQLLQVH